MTDQSVIDARRAHRETLTARLATASQRYMHDPSPANYGRAQDAYATLRSHNLLRPEVWDGLHLPDVWRAPVPYPSALRKVREVDPTDPLVILAAIDTRARERRRTAA